MRMDLSLSNSDRGSFSYQGRFKVPFGLLFECILSIVYCLIIVANNPSTSDHDCAACSMSMQINSQRHDEQTTRNVPVPGTVLFKAHTTPHSFAIYL